MSQGKEKDPRSEMLYQGPFVPIRENGKELFVPLSEAKGEIASPFKSSLQEYKDWQIDYCYLVDQEKIGDFIRLAEGDKNNDRHRDLAERVLGFGSLSAIYWAMGNNENGSGNTPLFLSHQADTMLPVEDGELLIRVKVVKVGTTSMRTEYAQYQAKAQDSAGENVRKEIGKGSDVLVFDPYPFPKPEGEIRSQAPQRINLDGYRECGKPYTPSQKDVEMFADITGDRNSAHLDPDYMKDSRFNCGTIAHGLLVLTRTLREATDFLSDRGVHGKMVELKVSFNAPVEVGKTGVRSAIKKHSGESYEFVGFEAQNLLLSGYFVLE